MQQDYNTLFATGQTVRVEYNDCSGKLSCHQAVVGSNDNAVIELLFELSELPILTPGSGIILGLQLEPDRPTLFYKAQVSDVYFGKAAIYVSNLEPADMASLRKYFRCDVSFFVKIEMDSKVFGGHAMNLSAGGMLVGMPLRDGFVVGRRMTCQFELEIGNPIIVRGEIVRVERIGNERIGIAIRFLSIHEKNQNDIIQYLFRCQREIMQKRKGIK